MSGRRSTDFTHTAGQDIDAFKNFGSLFIEQEVILPEVRTGHVPEKIFCFCVKRKRIGDNRVNGFDNDFLLVWVSNRREGRWRGEANAGFTKRFWWYCFRFTQVRFFNVSQMGNSRQRFNTHASRSVPNLLETCLTLFYLSPVALHGPAKKRKDDFRWLWDTGINLPAWLKSQILSSVPLRRLLSFRRCSAVNCLVVKQLACGRAAPPVWRMTGEGCISDDTNRVKKHDHHS